MATKEFIHLLHFYALLFVTFFFLIRIRHIYYIEIKLLITLLARFFFFSVHLSLASSVVRMSATEMTLLFVIKTEMKVILIDVWGFF